MRTKFATSLAALLVLASCATAPEDVRHVEWRAWLDSPGGELPFGLELREAGADLEAFLLNGAERIPVARVERDGATLRLGIEPYDSQIEATFGADGGRLDGRWEKTGVGGG